MDESIKEYCKILSLPKQVIVRVDNSVNTKIKKARFPFIATLEEYDFKL